MQLKCDWCRSDSARNKPGSVLNFLLKTLTVLLLIAIFANLASIPVKDEEALDWGGGFGVHPSRGNLENRYMDIIVFALETQLSRIG